MPDTAAKILFWDIESTDLQADFGNMLACGFKYLGQPAEVISLLDVNKHCKSCRRVDAVDDKRLLKQVWERLAAADVWVTWFGKGFDIKFVNTRLVDGGMPALPPIPHIDLYFTAKHHLKLSSNRLASVQDFLQLPTAKTPLTKRCWRRAQAGDVPSIRYIIDHCEKDVMVLEEAYERLKPYVRQHPNVDPAAGCRVCSGFVQRRGLTLVASGRKLQRVQCTKCGHWENRPQEKQRVVSPSRLAR